MKEFNTIEDRLVIAQSSGQYHTGKNTRSQRYNFIYAIEKQGRIEESLCIYDNINKQTIVIPNCEITFLIGLLSQHLNKDYTRIKEKYETDK